MTRPRPEIVVLLRDARFKAELEIVVPGSPTIYYRSEEIPEHLMDEFQEIVGDGRARVSVTNDVGIKEFGTGASASVTIVLTCNQDTRTIERAVALAGETARGYALQYRQQAENELQVIMQERQRQQMPR
jgi:hypothetical protein